MRISTLQDNMRKLACSAWDSLFKSRSRAPGFHMDVQTSYGIHVIHEDGEETGNGELLTYR